MYGPVRVCNTFSWENRATTTAASGASIMICHPLRAKMMIKASDITIPMVLTVLKSIIIPPLFFSSPGEIYPFPPEDED
jgi:hypothetical protein